MSEPVRVAINAQINPDTAGGVESSATSIMRYYREHPEQAQMTVLGLPAYLEKFQALVGENHRVARWTHLQEMQVTPGFGNIWWKRFERVSGPAKPFLDRASKHVKRRVLNWRLGQPSGNDAELRALDAEVVHFPYGSTFPTNLPFVFEPHDIQHRHYPEFFHPEQVEWRDRVYGDGCRNAAMVVTGSRWTKKDIMEQFGVPSERIATIPRSSFNARMDVTAARCRELLAEFKLPKKFAYYPAMTFPHKNHLRLFEALALLRDRDGLTVPLVMSGRSYKPHMPTLIRALKQQKLEDQVHLLRVVPDEMLAALFRSATFMVFPSLYEGLSQSLLEGLHVELPIVAATQSSIPETVGPAALLFDGMDTTAMADAIAKAWRQPKAMAALATKGGDYYRRYSWDRGGPMLTAVYRHVTGRKLSAADQDLLHEALLM